MTLKKLMVYGIVILSMAFWSMTYVWYKIVFKELTPISVMTIRLAFSAIFLLLFSKFTKRLSFPDKKDFLWFLLLSFFQPFLYFLGESHGANLVSPTISAVIISTIPVFTPFATYLFYGEKISVFNVMGIFLSFLGVMLVLFGNELHFYGSTQGIMLLFGAVLSALGYAVIIVKLTNKYNSFTIISWQNLFGALYFLPLFFFVDWHNFTQANFTKEIIVNLAYLAFFGSTVAYVFFTYSIKHLGIVKASMFTNIIPVFTAIFAFVVLGNKIDVAKGIGIGIVLTGLFLSQLNSRKKVKVKS